MSEPIWPTLDRSRVETHAAAIHPGFSAILAAILAPGHFDRLLAKGTPIRQGGAIAVHAERITSVRERELLARVLRRAIRESAAGTREWLIAPRVATHSVNVLLAEELIDQITLRLHSPRTVSPRGMALLRLVLTDGGGPFYRGGHGDLDGRLGAALAAF